MTPFLREWRVGPSLYRLEAPGLVCAKILGGGSLEEVRQVSLFYEELATVCPFFVLADMSEAGSLDAAGREYIQEHVRPEWFLGFIYFNTRLLHRSTALGIMLAYEMLCKERHPWRGKVHFVPDEADARELYAQLCAEHEVRTGRT